MRTSSSDAPLLLLRLPTSLSHRTSGCPPGSAAGWSTRRRPCGRCPHPGIRVVDYRVAMTDGTGPPVIPVVIVVREHAGERSRMALNCTWPQSLPCRNCAVRSRSPRRPGSPVLRIPRSDPDARVDVVAWPLERSGEMTRLGFEWRPSHLHVVVKDRAGRTPEVVVFGNTSTSRKSLLVCPARNGPHWP
jgi:hypothetical protein